MTISSGLTPPFSPIVVPWHNNKTLRKDPHPIPAEFNADVCDYLADNPAPFRKFPEPFLCFVGISRYYDLEEIWMNLFAFINHADPTKVGIGEREVGEREVLLLQLTRGRVVPLAGVNDQENANILVEEIDHTIQDEGVNIVRAEYEIQAIVAEKPKVHKKRRTTDGASGSKHPLKKLREDHGTSDHVGASTGGKSLVAIQELFEQSTLKVEVGVTAAATMPFVTSSVTPTPECGDNGPTDSVSMANLRTQCPSERFVISSDSSHDSSANVADDEVTSIVRSYVSLPPLMTAAIATTVIVGVISPPVFGAGAEPVPHSIFRDSASPSTAEAGVAGPSQPACAETSIDTFFISQDLDFQTLQQIYVPKWNVINDSALDDPEFNVEVTRQACFSVEVRLRSEHNYTERKKFERRCARLTGLLREKDVEVANLKAQLSLKKAEAPEAIRLCGQIETIEVAEAARSSELEGTCSELRDEVSGYKLFKEQIEVVQDEQVRVLSDCVAGLDSELIGMALYLDEEFYPHFLTTIARRRWILGRGLKLAVMKCLQSPEYLVALGGAMGRAIDKAEANYVFAVNAIHAVDCPPTCSTGASHLQPSPKQLMLPIHRLEDQVVIRETSLSFYLDVAHARVQRIRGNDASRQLSISNALVPLIEPLSVENLVGKASTSGVLVTAMTTSWSTTFIQASTVPPISVADGEVLGVGPSTEVPPPSKIMF
ncbi:hypothetical protein Tco_0943210, partial [Tanacetum coccineum]